MKRFYQTVSTTAGEAGHQVLLDGRPIRTPGQRPLLLPTADLASALAEEWAGQGETIEPAAMPLMRLAVTATDRMPELRAPAITDIVAYVATDLVCYRAGGPLELVNRQQQRWQPELDWLRQAFGIQLLTTTALLPMPQPEAASIALRALVTPLDDWPLVGLHATTTALGSVVLGLALWHGRLDPEQAFAASLLDELFEIERWGAEAEATRRQQVLRRDLAAAARLLRSFPPPPAAA